MVHNPWRDPFEVLGLHPGADHTEVKRRWRELAFQFHPDRDPTPGAAQKFAEVKRAADAILKHGYGSSADPVAAGAAAMRYHWAQAAAEGVDPQEFWNMNKRKTGPLWFAAACFAGGILLFGGAIWMHQWYTILTRPVPARRQVGTERGVYSYQTPQAVRERMENPDSRRQQLLDLVMEERRRKKESAAAAAGSAAGGSAAAAPAAGAAAGA